MKRQPRSSSILSGTLWQMLSQLAPLVVNLALTPFVIVSLGRDVYGLWIVIMTFSAFLGQFDGGITSTVIRYFAQFIGAGGEDVKRNIGRYAKSLALVIVALSAVTLLPGMVFAEHIANFFYTPPDQMGGATLLIRVALLTVMVGLLSNVVGAVLNAHRLFALTSLTYILGYVTYAITVFVSLSADWGLYGMSLAAALQSLVSVVWVVPNALRLMKLRGSGWMSRRELLGFASLAWKVQVNGLLNVFSSQGVMLIIGRLAPLQRAEFAPGMTFAQQLRAVPHNAGRPIQTTIGQTVGRAGAEAAAQQTVKLQRVWVILISGWVALAAPAAYHAVNIWLPLDSELPGLTAAIILFGYLWGSLNLVVRQYLLNIGRPAIDMWTSMIRVALLLLLSLLVAGRFGAIGVAVVFVVTQLVGLFLQLVVIDRAGLLPRSPLRDIPWIPAIVCSGVTAAVTTFVAGLLRQHEILGGVGLLLVAASAGPCFFAYLLWAFGPSALKQMVKNRKLG